MNNEILSNAGINADEQYEATKRLAQQGQWRTPPVPLFATGVVDNYDENTPASVLPTIRPTTLPTTTDEYARMLQEAYKRGAEAAARAQSQNRPIDCPNDSLGLSVSYQLPPTNTAMSHLARSATSSSLTNQPHTANAYSHQQSSSFSSSSCSNISSLPTTNTTTLANSYTVQATPMAQVPISRTISLPPESATVTRNSPSGSSQRIQSKLASDVHQSVSMPDMTSYHDQGSLAQQQLAANANANDEEEKRKKRLARNRESARLRRLKKKNLVDSYEGEVGILEAALAKLRSHEWGSQDIRNDNNHDALIEALSMERGQQPLTSETRRELIQSIVTQQKEQVANLMDCQLENWMLSCLADNMLSSSIVGEGDSAHFNHNNSNCNNTTQDDGILQLTSELQSLLQLTPQQLRQIQQSSQGCFREIQDLRTVESSLDAILSNQWLLDEGVDEVARLFTSILNPSQLSKFLLWTDHNADAIEKLDYVNVDLGVENSPVFEFGIDEVLEMGD